MKRYFSPLMLTSFLWICACQNNRTTDGSKTDKLTDSTINENPEQFCYSYIKNRDTATLNFMNIGDVTTGELTYKIWEKDSNKGIIEGGMKGDTLLLEYTFDAEGSESSREVVFLKKGNQLLQGTGEMIKKNGRMMFKDISKLKFGESIIFEKIDCK